ncbi:MAG: pantoate--beta-alanine ligase [Nitrospirota bacterium]
MKIIKTISEMRDYSREMRQAGETIGFAPTMGYLHDGHISLFKAAKSWNTKAVVSIFVNPTQFGPAEDLSTYPRDLEGDLEKCETAQVDAVFIPEALDMYPDGYSTYVDVSGVTAVMEGARRPGHFRGVSTVVAKLFNIVMPHKAYFGQKDYQQTVVVRRMAQDLNMGTEIVVMPTVREPDGLAMSSRNAYLSPQERAAALVIYRALSSAKSLYDAGERHAGALIDKVRETVKGEPLVELEYAEAAEAETLSPLVEIDGKAVLAVAARVGKTRLIDNVLL